MAGIVRDAAQRIGGAFAAGYRGATAPFDEPGPAIRPSPFTAGTVTPGAVALKSIAALIYGHRAAANYKQAQTLAAAKAQLQGLQIEALKQKVNPPTQTYDVPGQPGKTMQLPDTPATFRAVKPAAAKAAARIHTSASEAATLGVPFDATDSTVAQPDAQFAATRALHKTVNDRLTNNESLTQSRLAVAKHVFDAQTSIANLDKAEGQQADEAAAQAQAQHEAAARILQDPRQSITLREKAARLLGIGPKMYQPDVNKPEMAPMTGPNGVPIYDTAAIPAAIKAATLSAREKALVKIRAGNAAHRAALAQVAAAGSGVAAPDQSAPDPVLEALMHLSSVYAPQSAGADTSFIDQPAQ